MKSRTVFTYINSINDHEYIWDAESEKTYEPFLVNKAFSMHYDTCAIVAMLNTMPDISKKQHYDFLFNIIDPKKRWGKWHKSLEKDALLMDIAKYYEISLEKAQEIAKLMGDSEREAFSLLIQEGG